jgi:hypothetical protein
LENTWLSQLTANPMVSTFGVMGGSNSKEDGNDDRQLAIAEILRIRTQAILYLALALYWAATAMLLVKTMVDHNLALFFGAIEVVAAMILSLMTWLMATAALAGPSLF